MNSPANHNAYRFALILGIGSPFYRTIQKGAQEEAKALSVSLHVDVPEDFSAALQIPLIEACVAEKVDAILITPCDGTALIEPLRRAHEAGIPVITVDASLADGDYQNGAVTFPKAFVGSDNIQGGKLAAEALLKLIGYKGKIYIQSTAQGVSATDLREEGFLEVLSAHRGTVELVGTGYDGGSIDLAAKQTAEVLERVPDLAAIFGTGDYSTKGVVRALKQARKDGSIRVVRFDASEQAAADLQEGVIDLIIAQLPVEMGHQALKLALQAAEGRPDIPKYVRTDLVLIDHTNVQTPEVQAIICR